MAKAIILNKLLEYLDITPAKFERKIGVGGTTINAALRRNSNIKRDIVEKIIAVYPNVSREWLLTGEGEMLHDIEIKVPTAVTYPKREALPLGQYTENDAAVKTSSGIEYIDLGGSRYVMLTPLVDQYAYGGYLVGYKDPEYIEGMPKHAVVINTRPHGKYVTFEMRNDSMDDGTERSIKAGDKVTGRLIGQQYWKDPLRIRKFKEWIIAHNDGIIVKEIIEHDVATGRIRIHSYNPDKSEFPDEDIYLKDVKELLNVVIVTKDRN